MKSQWKSKSMWPLSLSRRTVVGGLGALGLSACTAPAQPPSGPFPLGVAAGDATPDGAVLWTRYAGAGALRLWVWEGDGERPADARAVPLPEPDEGFLSVPVAGLRAGAWHRYLFEAVDSGGVVLEASEVGRFRTALAADSVERLKIGAVCCTEYGHSFATLERAAEQSDLDAFLLLGDVVYTDGNSTVPEYRDCWARTIGSREYRALRRSTSVVAQWDDHEVRNNWDGATVDPQLYANARHVFTEHQPVRRDPSRPNRFWRKLSWGKTVDLFVLDSRGERSRARGEYLSPEQAQWLVQGIAESQAAFKLVLNTVPIGQFDTAFFMPFKDDMWQAFPEQRRAVLQGIDDSGAKGVVWLGGDFHLATVGRISRSGPGSDKLEVLVGPGAQSPNVLPSYPSKPQWDFSSAVNNYTTFELDPAAGTVRIQYHDRFGQVFFDRVYTP